jgi:preprotein translocase subunit SecG
MKKNLKRVGHVFCSIFKLFAKYFGSFVVLCLILIVQILASIEREFLKNNIGIENSYLYSMARKWVNDEIGYYLIMAVLIIVLVLILRHEYEDFQQEKAPQELD